MATSSAEPERTGRSSPVPAVTAAPGPERPEEGGGEGAAHRRRHQPGEDRAAGPDQGAGDQQQHVVEHVAAGRDGEAGEGVEQRDDDRDVGAADRQHEQHPDQQRDQGEQHQQQRRDGAVPDVDHHAHASATATARLPPKRYGPPGNVTDRVVISSCSLANVTQDPENDTVPTSTVKAPPRRKYVEPSGRQHEHPPVSGLPGCADEEGVAWSAPARRRGPRRRHRPR